MVAARKGSRHASRTNWIVQPRISREPVQTYDSVPLATSAAESRDPSSTWAERPSWSTCSWFSATIVSPAAGGVLAPDVLSVTAGVPRAMNGDCPYRAEGEREVDQLRESIWPLRGRLGLRLDARFRSCEKS
jgi:hypothetical protein